MEEKQYVVVAIKYYLHEKEFQIDKEFEVLCSFKEQKDAQEFTVKYNELMEMMKGKVLGSDRKMTTCTLETKEFDASLNMEDIKAWVDEHCSYEWNRHWCEKRIIIKK